MAFKKEFGDREIKEFASVKEGFRTRLLENAHGDRVLDIREFVDTTKYTGPTKRGIRLSREEIKKAIEVLTVALEEM